MGTHLKYSPNATIKNFATADIVEYPEQTATPEQQKEKIFSMANECRGGWYPIFEDDSKVLGIQSQSVQSQSVQSESTPTTTIQTDPTNYQSKVELTMPPKRKGLDIGEAIILGVGAFIVIKILS